MEQDQNPKPPKASEPCRPAKVQKHSALVRTVSSASDASVSSCNYKASSDDGLEEFVNILLFTGYDGAAGGWNGQTAKAANSGEYVVNEVLS